MTTGSVKPQEVGQVPAGPIGPEPLGPTVLKLSPVLELTDDQLLRLCSLNDALRIELNAKGELEILPPANPHTSIQNADLTSGLVVWARADGTGLGFDATAGFTLPNGAVRSPDASWIRKERWAELSEEEKRKFARIVPDFAVELRSPSDRLGYVQAKMQEYMDNGVRLGWLIDPFQRRVHVYRPGAAVKVLEGPETLSGDPELPGFSLDLKPIWEPDF